MTLTLFTYPDNPRAHKALIAAAYGGVEIEVADDFKMGETNKSPQFLAKNPSGKVPALDTPEGPVFESNAIARYVARLSPQSNLLGKCFYSQSQVDQWVDHFSLEIAPPVSVWVYPILGWGKPDAAGLAAAKETVHKFLAILDAHLVKNTFIIGNYVTLADIVGYASLANFAKHVLSPALRKQYPSVTRWLTTLVNQPQFKQVIGNFKFAEVEAEVVIEEKEAGGKKDKKKNDKPKDNKPKENKPKKEAEKKAAEPEPEENYDDEPKPVKKQKNPLDDLPKTPLVLDNVKRLFSNEEFGKAAAQFWTEYDAEGWSIWEGAYNYNNENTVFFMTCNLIGGYLQRLDSLRKYGFGALMVSGPEKGPFDVNAIFLVRGKVIPPELGECPDSEYYTWTEVKVDSDKGKARFAELMNGEKVNGKAVLERRYFK